MGGDWYTCDYYYGYGITIPKDKSSYAKFINTMYKINKRIVNDIKISKNPTFRYFRIRGFTHSIYSNMEVLDEPNPEPDCFVFGFEPTDNLEVTMEYAKYLREYIQTDILEGTGLSLSKNPGFYSGIDSFDYVVDKYYNQYYDYEED